jgi:pantoate kinase
LPRRASAFAPAAITNFFQIHYGTSGEPDGATGGGYILSKGTKSRAVFEPSGARGISTVVNGDPAYNARTTRRALELLAERYPGKDGSLVVEQIVETPIGSGFGASGASAVSGIYAAAAAMGIKRPRRELALQAHKAEIIEGTGLGTVSVVYNAIGAGAIVAPGVPGVARFVTVRVPKDLRLVTACLSPYDKRDAFSSASISGRVNRLGKAALASFLQDPSLETLASEGERFSRRLGLESHEVKKLIEAAKRAGALAASQNMIGYAVHSLVDSDRSEKVASAFRRFDGVRVDHFELGARKAGVERPSRR